MAAGDVVLKTATVIGTQRMLQYNVEDVATAGQFTTGLKYITGASAVNTATQNVLSVLIDATNTKLTCVCASDTDANARVIVTGYGGG